MALTLTSSITMLMMIAYFSIRKSKHVFQHFFILLVLEFTYTSFISVVNANLTLWEISKKTPHLLAFRLVEIFYVPLVILLFLDLAQRKKGALRKLGFFLICLSLLFGMDVFLLFSNVYKLHHWQIWWSMVVWISLMMIAYLADHIFKIFLKKEGVIK